jgi:hypothetical protein
MHKTKSVGDPVRFNFPAGKNKYFVLTDKTGYPSAQFRFRSGIGLLVPHEYNSSADPP